jgi:hypothetical protein
VDHNECDLTPWFDGRTKPIRVGVYMLKCGGAGLRDGYQHWDGKTWGPWHPSAEHAAQRRPDQRADLKYQNDNWRGLRKKPNVGIEPPRSGRLE